MPSVPSPAASRGVTVVSLNLARETDPGKILREFHEHPAILEADVLLLQEVAREPDGRQCVAEKLAAMLGRRVVYSPAAPGDTDMGLAILSRYPIRDRRVRALPAYNLVIRSRSRIALSATLDAPAGPMRISNAHLDTRINPEDRVRQLAPVVSDESTFRGPRIIAGDLNTNDFYWLGNLVPLPAPGTQGSRVRDFMTRHGFATALNGSPATHDLLGMRLDWVFINGLKAHSAAIYPMRFSDHHAVWVELAQ